jgi:eukaryotic-like serine/threonine-protein kinase
VTSDMIGRTLSHYRITAALGAGGMGEVYRATDAHLGRDVAIKVLPPEVAKDPERLGRFRREAQLLAALNHPNVAAIYGLEEADGKPFLALELVEGEDLKERLSRGAIPVEEALEIGKQVAEALEEAHNKGIVHRDLKPANVKLAPDGKVKVLDFGLAKAWAGDASGINSGSAALSQSPTLAHTGTIAGVILGTAAYMSPEQARGKPVDRRADVWSFGVLLWEMLTGRSLFAGDTVTDVIAAVVTREPDLDALPPATPGPVRRLLSRCLRKDPRLRLPDIGSARLELQEALAGTPAEAELPAAEATGAVRAALRGRARERWAWATLALALAGLAAVAALRTRGAALPASPGARFVVDEPEGWSPGSDFGWPVPSPDGRQVVYAAAREGASMLWVRPLGSLESRPLPGTEGATDDVLAWSPDSRSLAFVVDGELRRLNLADGTIQRICAMPAGGRVGADWSEQGTILFSAGGGAGRVYSVAAAGGEAKPLTTPDASRGEQHHHGPQFLPDGRHFLFLVQASDAAHAGLFVAPLDAPAEKRRVAPGWSRHVFASGHLLVVRDGTLLAQPFDPRRLETTGEPVAVASSVGAWAADARIGWFSASRGGTLAYYSGRGVTGQVQLAWLDRSGQTVGTLGEPGLVLQLVLSPDERNVALEVPDAEGRIDIWVMDVARGVSSRVTTRAGNDRDPVWSPDGRSLAFAALGEEKGVLRRKGLRAADPETVLYDAPGVNLPEFWTRDGQTILFVSRTDATDAQSVSALHLADGTVEPVLDERFRIDEPQLSPDERWLAYVSRESGRDEVYVEPFRREGERARVSVDGGGQPRWRGDGRELFYVSAANVLMAAPVRAAGDRLAVDLPTALFPLRVVLGTGLDDYAPRADGQRFLVKLPVGGESQARLHVLTGWASLIESPTR